MRDGAMTSTAKGARHGGQGAGGQLTAVDVDRPAAGSTTRAVVQDRHGSAAAPRLAGIARPEIADDEVLFRVHTAGLEAIVLPSCEHVPMNDDPSRVIALILLAASLQSLRELQENR